MFQKIRFFIPLAVAITGICALIYLTVQQNYRQSANDPQIQISEDTANLLAENDNPGSMLPADKVDIDKSLAPFVIVYDDAGKIKETNSELDGKNPELPSGALDYARANKQDRLTWQPRDDVRIAAVITRFESSNSLGFVLAGSNMREVEKREEVLEKHIFLAWIVIMAATFFATLIFIPSPRKK